jgi:hypothetical protein
VIDRREHRNSAVGFLHDLVDLLAGQAGTRKPAPNLPLMRQQLLRNPRCPLATFRQLRVRLASRNILLCGRFSTLHDIRATGSSIPSTPSKFLSIGGWRASKVLGRAAIAPSGRP